MAKHTVANVAGAVIPLTVALLTVPLYLKLVGTERYGALAIIWVLLNYFSFFNLGLGRAVTQRLSSADLKLTSAEASRLVWTAASATLAASIVGGVILWRVASWYMGSHVDMGAGLAAEVERAVGWLPIILPVVLLSSILQGSLQARLKFFHLNAIQSAVGILAQLLPLMVAAMGRVELQHLIPAAFLPRVLGAMAMALLVRRHLPLGAAAFDWTQLKKLLTYGGWVSLISVFAPLLVILDRMVIAGIHGARYVTYYTVPHDLVTKLLILSGSLSSAIFPRLAAATDPATLADRSTRILLQAITPLVVAGVLVVEPFLHLWVGADLALHGGPVAQIILVGVWINALVVSHGSRLLATKNPRDIAIIYLIQLPIYFAGLWYAVENFNVVGAAFAWTARVLLDAIMVLTLARALMQVAKMSIAPGLLVAASFLPGAYISMFSSLWWIAALSLVLASVYYSRHLLMLVISPARSMVRESRRSSKGC